MSIQDTIRKFSKTTVRLERISRGGLGASGRSLSDTKDVSFVNVSVQPTSGSDQAHLPEGIYVNSTITVWSADEQLVPGDRITARGVQYEVVHVNAWDQFSGGWKALCRRAG